MPSREYCCCAIPITNAGVYMVLTEQLVLGFLVGILSVATPSIVGASTPSFAPWILGIIGFIAAGIQLLGLFGVAKQKHILFRRYISLHSIVTLAGFAVATTWTVISASRHSNAKSKCISDFFDTKDSDLNSESQVLCDIFPWVDIGIMAGLLVLLALLHIYFYVILNTFSNMQQDDHAKYSALNDSMNTINTDNIPMNDRLDKKDNVQVYTDDPGHSHARQDSAASMTDIMNQPIRQPADGFSNYNANYQNYYNGRQPAYTDAVPPPGNAYTNDPGPTPKFSNTMYYGESSNLDKPPLVYNHPAEGSFGRKTPKPHEYY